MIKSIYILCNLKNQIPEITASDPKFRWTLGRLIKCVAEPLF